ncbi:MAG: hypothetical protein ACRENW_02455 [Thermodesulfobacteriota bacterium]
MDLSKISLTILVLTFFTTLSFSGEEDNKNVSALGFNFGISKKDALEIIKSQGKKVVEDTVDSKEIRTIIVEGALIELPVDTSNADLKTNLEFYDNELMASSLVFKPNTILNQSALEAELFKYLSGLYGEPAGKEEVLGITTWAWHITDIAVILSSNPKNNVARIDYVYKPLNQSRIEDEFNQKQQGETVEPAKQMFIDGNYSAPKK